MGGDRPQESSHIRPRLEDVLGQRVLVAVLLQEAGAGVLLALLAVLDEGKQ